jgi:hypothetical protein
LKYGLENAPNINNPHNVFTFWQFMTGGPLHPELNVLRTPAYYAYYCKLNKNGSTDDVDDF